MLVLSRKKCQQIQIGDSVTITILRVKGQAVQVGIEAPRDIKVMRAELEPLPEPTLRERVCAYV
jgi:carbon storage regulator